MLTPLQQSVLRCILDRLIPPDDFPGAGEAGGVEFVERLLRTNWAPRAVALAAGLEAVNSESQLRWNVPMVDLAVEKQDQLITSLEADEIRAVWPTSSKLFIEWLTNLAAESYYSDPSNGGNRDQASWRMIGYTPRVYGNLAGPPGNIGKAMP